MLINVRVAEQLITYTLQSGRALLPVKQLCVCVQSHLYYVGYIHTLQLFAF